MNPCDKLKIINKPKDKITNKTYYKKQQCQKFYVNNTSGKNVYIASGLYPVDSRDELIYNNCVDDDVKNVRNKNDNDIVCLLYTSRCV